MARQQVAKREGRGPPRAPAKLRPDYPRAKHVHQLLTVAGCSVTPLPARGVKSQLKTIFLLIGGAVLCPPHCLRAKIVRRILTVPPPGFPPIFHSGAAAAATAAAAAAAAAGSFAILLAAKTGSGTKLQ